MTYLTERFLQKRILRSQFLGLALISLVLIALQAAPASAQWTTPDASNNIHNTNDPGNVGIGTATPAAKLHIKGTGASAVTNSQILRVDGGITHGLDFGVLTGSPWTWWIQAKDNNGTSFTYPLALNPAGGNVGIGTTNPSAKLEVSGNINVTGSGNITAAGTITGGTINAKYQDVAEWVPASEQIPAGTVVVLDSTKSNHVISSTRGYDTRVAGVISQQPGIALGESGNGKVLVATTGRVRVKVDASQGPIQVGDLLVTSDKAGMAMKSQPLSLSGVQLHRPGTLIGKTLEPLVKGEGEILVLLILQ